MKSRNEDLGRARTEIPLFPSSHFPLTFRQQKRQNPAHNATSEALRRWDGGPEIGQKGQQAQRIDQADFREQELGRASKVSIIAFVATSKGRDLISCWRRQN